jgi:hypothetical protein
MAKNNRNVYKLPAETRKRLEDLGADYEKQKAALATLKKVGIDTTQLEQQLESSNTQRQIMLNEFD